MSKIILEQDKCISCGSCQVVCPKHFELKGDGKADLLRSVNNPKNNNEELEIEAIDCIKDAASVCPVQIIHIEN